jgi:type VI secretion system secreted protein Hcp
MSDMFLLIKDGPKGESQDSTFKAPNMVIQSFSFGASNPSTVGPQGSGSGASKGMPSSINIIKDVDASDPALYMATLTGDHFASATLVCRKSGGTQNVFYQIDLTEVFVTNYNISGNSGSGSDTPGCSFSLTFSQITITYTPQDTTGKKGTPIKQGYNVVTQKKAT